ncbi:unnamed protein product [Calypogeia fissa]
MAHPWFLQRDNRLLQRKVNRVALQAEDTRLDPYEGIKDVLPGLPNDVTFCHITTKLPWQTIVFELSGVNWDWQKAIRSRLVYNARVASGSTEALVVVNYTVLKFEDRRPSVLAIGLYSITEGSFHRLPPIPGEFKGIPRDCQCASLDGRIYVLGGFENRSGGELNSPSPKMYVMDLAGRGQWERCADMPFGRVCFGCGVMDGKIYVCGVRVDRWDNVLMKTREAEMYDPKQDKWSKLRSMEETRVYSDVTVMGSELVVHCGRFNNYDIISPFWATLNNSNVCPMVYSPVNQEWRTIDLGPSLFDRNNNQVMFVARAEFHQMNMHKLFVFDNDTTSWIQRHKISWAGIIREIGNVKCASSWTTLAVDKELVMVLTWHKGRGRNKFGTELLYSKGFGGRNTFLQWKKADIFNERNPGFLFRDHLRLMISVVKL